MSLEEIRPHVERWRSMGRRYGEAVLVETWRSAPRRPGARFVRSEDGEIAGNISAGCVEADLAERLDALLSGSGETRVTYDVSDETAQGVGLACGGRLDVHLAVREADDPIWPLLLRRLDARDPAVLVTSYAPGARERRHVLDATGESVGEQADPSPDPGVVDAARALSGSGGVRRIERSDGAGMVVEAILPPRRIVVVGATPVGAALARLATAARIPVRVVEPRTAYASAVDDDGVEVDSRWPGEALADEFLDPWTAVAVVAHDRRIDREALERAAPSSAGYVGLLGGGRTRRARLAALREAGVAEANIERIRAPIGLDIAAELPGEIALAVLAQIVAVWRGAA